MASMTAGQKFGTLTVIEPPKTGNRVNVRCECGTLKSVRVDHLLSGGTRSCGCRQRGFVLPEDLVGHRFGQITVEALTQRNPVKWRVRCDCGQTTEVWACHLRAGRVKSCGCGRLKDRSKAPPAAVRGARWLPLTRGKFTLVDVADYDDLVKFNWHFDGSGYAATCTGLARDHVRLHRALLGNEPKMVDHINGDKLDNRRCNLRPVTATQSVWNTRKRRHTRSKYRGVDYHRHNKKWRARLRSNGIMHYLGYFDTEEAAARAYDVAAAADRGEFAKLNFPVKSCTRT